MSHATEQKTIYIHALRQRLDIPLGTFMAALRSAYGVVMLGRLSESQAAEVVYRLRRLAYGLRAMPEDARDLFAGDWQEAA